MEKLVYVQFNARITNKKRRAKEKGLDVLLAKDASKAQSWIVECDDDEVEPGSDLTWEMVGEATGADEMLEPRRSARNVVTRELHEEDFVSDDDSEEEENDEEYESDGEHIVEEGYGDEEEMEF